MTPRAVLACLLLAAALGRPAARDWMGLRKPGPAASPAAAAPAAPVARPRADTLRLAVLRIPAGPPGDFLGTLEGVRCFNCEPGLVHLNLGDSLSREAGMLALRAEAWNAVERPIRDRRLFDHANTCFHFGYEAVDTVLVGGEPVEVRITDVPCYPYVRRLGRRPGGRAPADPAPAAAADSAPAPRVPQAQAPDPD